jgi:hypothetical protein
MRLNWESNDNRIYEYGVDRGVFYPPNGAGEAWNGLVSVQEAPTESDRTPRYLDGVKVDNRSRAGEFAGTIEAFTYPESFYETVLVPRRQKTFGLSYSVMTSRSYKIHLVYNILLSPDTPTYDQSDASAFSWDFTTRARPINGASASSHLVIDVSKAYAWTVSAFEDVLYGSEGRPPQMPTPEEVLEIFEVNSLFRVIDNGDGSFTATGPDEAIQMLDSTTFQITWDTAVMIDQTSYTLSSL